MSEKNDERLMPPYKPYKGQREQMRQLKEKTGTNNSQITRDAIAAYIKKELKK